MTAKVTSQPPVDIARLAEEWAKIVKASLPPGIKYALIFTWEDEESVRESADGEGEDVRIAVGVSSNINKYAAASVFGGIAASLGGPPPAAPGTVPAGRPS